MKALQVILCFFLMGYAPGSQLNSYIKFWENVDQYTETGYVINEDISKHTVKVQYRYKILMLVGKRYQIEIEREDGNFVVVNAVVKNGDTYFCTDGLGRMKEAINFNSIATGYTGSGWSAAWMFGRDLCFKEREDFPINPREVNSVEKSPTTFFLCEDSRVGWTAELGINSPVIARITWKPLGSGIDERRAVSSSWINKDGSVGTWRSKK